MVAELFFLMSILAASLLIFAAFTGILDKMIRLRGRFFSVPVLLTCQFVECRDTTTDCAQHLRHCLQGFADTLRTSTARKPCKTLGSKQT